MILFSTRILDWVKKAFFYLQLTKNVVGSHKITNIGCIKFKFFDIAIVIMQFSLLLHIVKELIALNLCCFSISCQKYFRVRTGKYMIKYLSTYLDKYLIKILLADFPASFKHLSLFEINFSYIRNFHFNLITFF
jgi:hypothetical protein